MSTSLVLAVTAGAFGGTGHWQCTNGLYSDVVCWDGDFPGDLGDVAVVDWDNFGTAYTLDMDLDVNVGSVNVESPDARFLIDDNVLNFAVSLNVLPGAVVDLRNGSIVGDVGIITNGGDLIVRGTSLIDLQAFDNNNFLQLLTNFQNTTLTVDNPIFNAATTRIGPSPCCVGNLIVLEMLPGSTFTNAALFDVVASSGTRRFRGDFVNQGVMQFGTGSIFEGADTILTSSSQLTVTDATAQSGLTFTTGAALTMTDGLLDIAPGRRVELQSGATFNFLGGATAGEIRLQDGTTLVIGEDAVGVGEFHLRGDTTLTGHIQAPQTVVLEATAGGSGSVLTVSQDTFNFGELRFNGIGCCAGLDLTLTIPGGLEFTNMGLVNIPALTGPRLIHGAFTNLGSFLVAQNTTFNATGDDFTNASDTSITGPIDLTISGEATMTQNSGVVDGDGELVLLNGGTLNYNGGDLLATTRLQSGTVNIGPDNDGAATITVRGTSTLTGDIQSGHVVHLAAPAGATVTLNTPADVANHGVVRLEGLGCCVATTVLAPAPGTTFTNHNLIDVTQTVGAKAFSGPVHNAGTLLVSQTLSLANAGATLTNSGLISVGDAVELQSTNGALVVNEASGRIEGGKIRVNNQLDNFGVLAPGLPIGVMQFIGAFDLDATGTLEIELAGLTPATEHDQVMSFSTLQLGGTLELVLADDFRPQVGDTFTIVSAPISGVFDAVVAPFGADVQYLGNAVVVTVTSVPPPAGDLDGDGDVDAADLAALLAAWGSSGPVGDLDGDGDVDPADLSLLLANWTG